MTIYNLHDADIRKTTPAQQPMKVRDLIKHLKTLDQTLPVFYVMFDDGYNIVSLTSHDVIETTMEKDDKEFSCVVLGEGWLM
jgi:hypothetical protein